MTRMYCDHCKTFTEHKHYPATASNPVNRWECTQCGRLIEAPLNPSARAKLRKEARREKTEEM